MHDSFQHDSDGIKPALIQDELLSSAFLSVGFDEPLDRQGNIDENIF
jgi:hypothetical protein